VINNHWAAFRGRRILLLQGPVGPFFRKLSDVLSGGGAQIHKVNFNGGDCLFYPTGAFLWRGRLEDWPEYFASLLDRLEIDLVVLFGDCRSVHRIARDIATLRGVQVGAFEEGYVRPNFITFEQDGVNGYSLIPREPSFFLTLRSPQGLPEINVGNTFWNAAMWAAMYYLAAAIAWPWLRHYRHHRPLSLAEMWPWLRGAWRKAFYSYQERGLLNLLTRRRNKRFFLVPLQIASDSQVSQHSNFKTAEDFILTVVESFAINAPSDTTLVIKHHPLDRGYHDYGLLLRHLAQVHKLVDRLLYIHDQHLPTLLEHMRGAVVINSTVGLSALSHGAAVKTCGRAIYDIQGLTFQGPLDDFWRAAEGFHIDHELFRRFRAYVIDQTQINSSFYKGAIPDALCASMTSSTQAEDLPCAGQVVKLARSAVRTKDEKVGAWKEGASQPERPLSAAEQ
jgi:capsular polysaccharide export protein